MTTFRPTEIHQLAIQAKLNFALGARVYDDVFAGFEVLEIVGDELRGWATSEYRAAVIGPLAIPLLYLADAAAALRRMMAAARAS